MDQAAFLSRLQGVRQTGQGFMACCPAHEDHEPSLSIAEGEDGRILLHCHAGCSAEEIVAALGLAMRDLFVGEEGEHGTNGHPQRGTAPAPLPPIAEEIVEGLRADLSTQSREYLQRERMLSAEVIDRYRLGIIERNGVCRLSIPVADADGLIRDIRLWLPPKFRKDGARKMLAWEKGRGATRLYPEDQLACDELVFCEGELDALALISHGIPAITLTNGADTVPDEQMACLFATKAVTFLMDHDEAGRNGTLARAETLAPYARQVKIASWPEDRPEGWDATDELKDYGVESLKSILAAAVPFEIEQRQRETVSAPAETNGPLAVSFVGSSPGGSQEAEWSEPRPLPAPPDPNRKAQREANQERPTVRRLAEVDPEEVSWLWFPRIPLRHLTTLEGDPGEGKSFAAQAIATAVSRGQGLPDMDTTTPANVLLLAAEDHAGCTIRPRLEALGADLERVFCCTDGFTLDAAGLEILEELLKETLPRLVVIDPLTAYLPSNLDLHRANEVRAPLKALATLAERFDCAILIIRHLAKGSTSKAIYRGLGSIDITAAARSALLAGHDPDNRDQRAIVQIKSNLGPLADPVGYSIELGRFAWTGSTGLTAGQILAPEVEDGAMSEARRFLRELLSEGTKEAKEVEEEAKAAGISSATLRRAKKALGIKVAKQGFQGAYHWSLPIEEGVL